jgi:hypothetical protein
VVVELLAHEQIFHKIKVKKHILAQCCVTLWQKMAADYLSWATIQSSLCYYEKMKVAPQHGNTLAYFLPKYFFSIFT